MVMMEDDMRLIRRAAISLAIAVALPLPAAAQTVSHQQDRSEIRWQSSLPHSPAMSCEWRCPTK